MEKVLARFQSEDGELVGPPLTVPTDITTEQLEILINQLLQNDERLPYAFSVDDCDILHNIQKDLFEKTKRSTEDTLNIIFKPQAVFKVRSVTRCSSTLAGHADAVLCMQFSPDGKRLISGSGDTTVRLWDLNTETPIKSCEGHCNWVLCVSWSPDGRIFASGGMDGNVLLWDGYNGNLVGTLKGHTKWITSLSWEPFHINTACSRLASSSKDGTVRVWNVLNKKCEHVLSQHTDAISCVKWGGEGLIYTGSRDKSIRVWEANEGKLCRVLQGHAHWINTMALSTEYALRTGAFDHTGKRPASIEEAQRQALSRYQAAKGSSPETLATGSDDFTLHLWVPSQNKKPIARLTGHQQLINHVTFSPDGRLLASASFDKSVKLWDAKTGKFINSLRGHVGSVYQIAFSADSRLLLSGSKDSTLKVWDLKTCKLKADLPGHADEVFAVDWSPVGEHAASGGKDKMIKFWKS